jgi:4-carboxymuconolactone decarboxylase
MTAPGTDDRQRADAVRARYHDVFGTVPPGIEQRIAVAQAAGRLDAIEVIEHLRRVLLADNPLDARVQQLVHFAQLVALGHGNSARLHARGAMRGGATMRDLIGVAETSLVTSGMPAYSLAVGIIAELSNDTGTAPAPGDQR